MSGRNGGQFNSKIRGNAKKRDGMLRNEAYVGILVYGLNRLLRDPIPATNFRPADTDDTVYQEVPEFAIVADNVWNKVQDRLEATHAQYSGKTSPLNDSHRARYLLNGLVTCGCCGGGYTITGKTATAAVPARHRASRSAETAARSRATSWRRRCWHGCGKVW